MTEMRERRAKAMAAITSVGAMLRGDAGIFKRLKAEHAEISSLLKQVAATKGNGVEVRRRLFPKIKNELLAHSKAEEHEFYELLKAFADTRDIVSRNAEEHGGIEQLLHSLETMNVEPASWMDVFEQLKLRVEHHVDEEEHKLFPLAKQHIDRRRADAIERRYLEAKRRYLRIFEQAYPNARV
ncbi:MAG TPA: hemerythrin domain-containing protein [Polyangiaceae bacterium]|nr:hemerythrin domain-containing protein [Polyangiaceae bacterium]